MPSNPFPKKMRLSGRSAVAGLFASGEGGFIYPFRYVCTEEPADGDKAGVAVLITVSKKYHKRANKRNVLKRRTREAFRTGNKELAAKAESKSKRVNIALMYSTKDVLEFKVISYAVGKILMQIGKKL